MKKSIPWWSADRRCRGCRFRSGLSLVELLAVLGVIGLLSVILVAVTVSVRQASDQSRCASNLRQMGSAGLMMIADADGRMPDVQYWFSVSRPAPESLFPYLGYEPVESRSLLGEEPTVMTCPAVYRDIGPERLPKDQRYRTYSINQYACASINGKGDESPYTRHAKTIYEVKSPSEMCFFMEGIIQPSGTPRRYAHSTIHKNVWSSSNPSQEGLYAGHGGRANIVFLDGHVESRLPSEIPYGSNLRRSPFWGSLE